VRVERERSSAVEILDEAPRAVPLARRHGRATVPDVARNLLPVPPVGAVVAALHLVSRGGRAPQKARGEGVCSHPPPCAGSADRLDAANVQLRGLWANASIL